MYTSRVPARCRASNVRTTCVCALLQNARCARLSASMMSPTSTMHSASTPCRNSLSSRARACRNPRWMSDRNSVRTLVLRLRTGLTLAMQSFSSSPWVRVASVVRRCVGSVTVWISISYELAACDRILSRRSVWGAGGDDALGREVAGKSAANPECALYLERGAVALQDMLDDGEAEAGATGRARAPGIDAIEALGEPRNVLRRDTHAGVADREVPALIIH